MATKKQKRELGAARQAENLANSIATGLKAQEKDKLRRARKAEEARQTELLKRQQEGHKTAVANIHSGLSFGEGDDGGCN